MEEDLKRFKVEYLSNHKSDLPQILNVSWGDKPKSELYLPQTLNLNLGDQYKIKNNSAAADLIFLKF